MTAPFTETGIKCSGQEGGSRASSRQATFEPPGAIAVALPVLISNVISQLGLQKKCLG